MRRFYTLMRLQYNLIFKTVFLYQHLYFINNPLSDGVFEPEICDIISS